MHFCDTYGEGAKETMKQLKCAGRTLVVQRGRYDIQYDINADRISGLKLPRFPERICTTVICMYM